MRSTASTTRTAAARRASATDRSPVSRGFEMLRLWETTTSWRSEPSRYPMMSSRTTISEPPKKLSPRKASITPQYRGSR